MPNDTANQHDIFIKLTDSGYVDVAKELHKAGRIYALFGFLDGLSCSYGTCKWYFDLFLPDACTLSNIHEWMDPAEIIALAVGSASLAVFSTFANIFNAKDANKYKSYVVILWPYFRHLLKGLKNAYKGLRSTLQVIELLGLNNATSLIIPLGLFLGVLTAANRILYCYISTRRKNLVDKNDGLLLDIISQMLSMEELQNYQNRIKVQQAEKILKCKQLAYLSAAFGGIIDGFYLYVGVLCLASLATPALAAMTIFCGIYLLACIATRLYEEYGFQRNLALSQAKVELALCRAEIKLALAQEANNIEVQKLLKVLKTKILAVENLSSNSHVLAFFAGMRNGLAVYCAISCALFSLSIFIYCPPALLISGIALGMVALLICTAYSLSRKSSSIRQPDNSFFESFLVNETALLLEHELIKVALNKSSPSTPFFNWWEVTRSFFSGMGKGTKALNFINNFFQDEEKGVVSLFLIICTAISAIAYSIVLALRAFARAFGRQPIDVVLSHAPASELKVSSSDSREAVCVGDTSVITLLEDCNNNTETYTPALLAEQSIKEQVAVPVEEKSPVNPTKTYSSPRTKQSAVNWWLEKPSSSRESGGFSVPDSQHKQYPQYKQRRSSSISFFAEQETAPAAKQAFSRRRSLCNTDILRSPKMRCISSRA